MTFSRDGILGTNIQWPCIVALFLEYFIFQQFFQTRSQVCGHLYVFLRNTLEYIIEKGEYEFVQLFADLGAVWGMYLGIAFATIMEVLDLACKPLLQLAYISTTKRENWVHW